jgi:hypothetical protein
MGQVDKIKKAYEIVKAAVEPLKRLKGWSGVGGLIKCAPHVVEELEKAGAALELSGADKKTVAVQLVLELVPDAWAPDWVLEPIVSWAIEKAVAVLKKRQSPDPEADQKA